MSCWECRIDQEQAYSYLPVDFGNSTWRAGNLINLLFLKLEKRGISSAMCYEKVTNSHGKSLNLWAHRSVPRPGAGGLGSELVGPFFASLRKTAKSRRRSIKVGRVNNIELFWGSK